MYIFRRKLMPLVQIESFAMVLAQILHIRGLSTPETTMTAQQPSITGTDIENDTATVYSYRFELSGDGRIVQDSVPPEDTPSTVKGSNIGGAHSTGRRYGNTCHCQNAVVNRTEAQ